MSLWVAALVLAVIAACRLTHLVTSDRLFEPLRDWASTPGGPRWRYWLWELLRCPWCAGFWISLAAVTAAWLVAPNPALPWWYAIPAEAFGASYVVGWLAGWEDDD